MLYDRFWKAKQSSSLPCIQAFLTFSWLMTKLKLCSTDSAANHQVVKKDSQVPWKILI